MKPKLRRGILISVSALLLFSGCSKGKEANVEGNQSEFTYWVPMPAATVSAYQNLAELPMYQELEKRTGITIRFIHPTLGQESEQFNLMIASGELPDMVEYGLDNYFGGAEKAIADNVVYTINDIMEECAPNLTKALAENEYWDRESKTDSGQYYGFPSLNTDTKRCFGGLMVRSDWLKDLGLEMPETIDEWDVVLKAFRDEKGAEAPFTGMLGHLAHTSTVINPFNSGFNVGKSFYMEDGKIKFGPIEPAYKDYIAKLNEWYAGGLIDRDFDTNDTNSVNSKMMTGKSGVTFGFVGSGLGQYLNAAAQNGSDFDLEGAPYPVKNKGDQPRFINLTFETNGILWITTACKDPKTAAKWADYMYTEDGKILKNFGIEGDTYTKEGDQYLYTDKILKNEKGLSISEAMQLNFRSAEPGPGYCQLDQYLDQYYQLDQQKRAIVTWNAGVDTARNYMLPPITFSIDVSDEKANLELELNTYVSEQLLKFIQGVESMENYDRFVEQCHKMKVDRLIEIYQEALDRYYAR